MTQRHRAEGEEGEVLAGAVALGRRCQFDEAHARHVARLSLSLFDQLGPLHELGAADRRILLGGALLHDIGKFVADRKHHKHSFYLIAHSELPGFAPREVLLVALVARYHRRALPRKSHPGTSELDAEERRRVTRLAALLRLADALDREHRQAVARLDARLRDDVVELEAHGRGELTLEQRAVRKKSDLFEKAFGREVRLRLRTDGGEAEA